MGPLVLQFAAPRDLDHRDWQRLDVFEVFSTDKVSTAFQYRVSLESGGVDAPERMLSDSEDLQQ